MGSSLKLVRDKSISSRNLWSETWGGNTSIFWQPEKSNLVSVRICSNVSLERVNSSQPGKERCSSLVNIPKESGRICNLQHPFKSIRRRFVKFPKEGDSPCKCLDRDKSICCRFVKFPKESGNGFIVVWSLRYFKEWRWKNSCGNGSSVSFMSIFSRCFSIPMDFGNLLRLPIFNSLSCKGACNAIKIEFDYIKKPTSKERGKVNKQSFFKILRWNHVRLIDIYIYPVHLMWRMSSTAL